MSVSLSVGPSDQKRLGHVSHCAKCEASNPPGGAEVEARERSRRPGRRRSARWPRPRGARRRRCQGGAPGASRARGRVSFTAAGGRIFAAGIESSEGALPHEDRDRVLKLRAARRRCRRLAASDGSVELGLGLRDVLVGVDSVPKKAPGRIEVAPVRLHGRILDALLLVCRPQLEVVLSQLRLNAEARVCQVGCTGLRRVGVCRDRVADLAPEVGLPGGLDRKREELAGPP